MLVSVLASAGLCWNISLLGHQKSEKQLADVAKQLLNSIDAPAGTPCDVAKIFGCMYASIHGHQAYLFHCEEGQS